MSEEIKRYTVVGDDFEAVPDTTGKWVRHDAAQSQLAALREELANETERANMNALKARHAKQDLNSIQKRLADAERRNSECIALLRRSTAGNGENLKMWWNERALILQAALNPNPEAASHDE